MTLRFVPLFAFALVLAGCGDTPKTSYAVKDKEKAVVRDTDPADSRPVASEAPLGASGPTSGALRDEGGLAGKLVGWSDSAPKGDAANPYAKSAPPTAPAPRPAAKAGEDAIGAPNVIGDGAAT